MYNTNDIFLIQVKIKRIVKENDEDFFKIIKGVVVDQVNETTPKAKYLKHEETLFLDIPYLTVGDVFEMRVSIRLNKTYGYFLQVIGEPTIVMPVDEKDMTKFLNRRLDKVGKVVIERMVSEFGMDVINEVRRDYKQLVSLNIPEAKAKSIYDQLETLLSFDKLVNFLFPMDISIKTAELIYLKYKHESIQLIQRLPYEIADIDGIDFTVSDIIANTLHKNPLSHERVKSAIKGYLVKRRDGKGDVCVPKDQIFNELANFLKVYGGYQNSDNSRITSDMIERALGDLVKFNVLVLEYAKDNMSYYYLKELNTFENEIVSQIKQLSKEFRVPIASTDKINHYLDQYESGQFMSDDDKKEGKKPFKLAFSQRNAIYMSLLNNFSILTGGPGTGKTATTNMIVQTLNGIDSIIPGEAPKKRILLLAPTGKARKRLSELTGRPAQTIHSRLKIGPHDNGEKPQEITDDLVIVDEFSMVDIELWEALLKNISENTRLLLVGDVDQLPSIGPGLILRDLIDSKVIPVTRLNEIFRQAQDSQIVTNSYKLNAGLGFNDDNGIKLDPKKNDMYFIKTRSEVRIKQLIIEAIDKQVNKYGKSIEDICVLSPMRIGGLGTIELNKSIQALINPPTSSKSEITIKKDEEITYRVNDRVMHLTNDVEKKMTNGEQGLIKKIYTSLETSENGTVKSVEIVDIFYRDELLGDRIVSYNETEMADVELAYAMSIHKSQGSEFPIVIMPFHVSHKNMLERNLIYTGWTRAKEMLLNIGDPEMVDFSAKRVRSTQRYSLLKEKLSLTLPTIN